LGFLDDLLKGGGGGMGDEEWLVSWEGGSVSMNGGGSGGESVSEVLLDEQASEGK